MIPSQRELLEKPNLASALPGVRAWWKWLLAAARTRAMHIWYRLTEPSAAIAEPERRRDARLLSSLLVVLVPLGYFLAALPILVTSTGPVQQNAGLLIMTGATLVLVVAYLIGRGRKYEQAVVIALAVGMVAILLPNILEHNPNLIGVDYLLVLVLFGSMFLSSNATLGVITFCLAGTVVLPMLVSGVAVIDLLEGPVSFLLIGSGLVLLSVRRRDELENDRRASLLASEERLRLLLESSEDIILMQDLEGRYSYYNASPQYGIRAADLLGQTPSAVHEPAVARQIMDRIRQVATTGKGLTTESQVKWQGKELSFSDYSYPVKDRYGQIVSIATISRNITERKRAEEERLKFGLGIDRSGEAIFITDPVGTITYVNPAFERTYGFSKAEAVGQNPRILKSGVLSPERYRHFWETILAKKVITGELINKTKDGRLLNVEGTTNPILDAEGEITGFLSIQRDVTERKKADQVLHESEEQYRLLFESNPHPMWVYDLETLAFLAVNAAAIHHYGYTRAEFLAMTLKDIRPPEEIPALLDSVARTPDGLEESGVWRHRKKDGSILYVEITSHMIQFAGRRAKTVLANDITQRRRAEEHSRRQLERLAALREIDRVITSSTELKLTLNVLLAQVTRQLGVDAASVLLLDPFHSKLAFAAGLGFRSKAIATRMVSLGEGPAGRAAVERRVADDLHSAALDNGGGRSPQLAAEEFAVCIAAPLIAKGEVKGVLELFHRTRFTPDEEWLDFLETLAGQASIAIESAEMLANLHQSHGDLVLAYDMTLEGWARALDLRDKETEGHTQRVSEVSVRLARAMGINESDLVHIRRGALLHDIGKIGIPDHILLKPGPLTDEEWVVMRKHPAYAFEMLTPIEYLRPALDIPYCHHEKWDGTGYPRALHGEQIPLAARLFAVVDVWDALRSNRPYRPAWSAEQVYDHIRKGSGVHFDPRAVEAFLPLQNANHEQWTPRAGQVNERFSLG